MFFTQSADIESLINWWYSPDHWLRKSQQDYKPDYLCFVIGGNIQFEELFNDFLKKIYAFDIVTGKHIAVFFYSQNLKISIKCKEKEGHGLGISRKNSQYKNIGYQYAYRLAEIDFDDLKGEFFENNFKLSKLVIDYFKLKKEQYPSILLLSRKKDNPPLILPLKGEKSVKFVFSFFEDLVSIIQKVKTYNEDVSKAEHHKQMIKSHKIKLDELNLSQKETIKELEKLRELLKVEQEKLDNSINELKTVLSLAGVPEVKISSLLNSPNFSIKSAWKVLGLQKGISPTAEFQKYSNRLIELVFNERKEKSFRTVQKQMKKVRELSDRCSETLETEFLKNMNERILLTQKSIQHHKNELTAENKKLIMYENERVKLDKTVEKLIRRNNKLISIRNKYWGLKDFVQEIVGWIKPAKEIQDFLDE